MDKSKHNSFKPLLAAHLLVGFCLLNPVQALAQGSSAASTNFLRAVAVSERKHYVVNFSQDFKRWCAAKKQSCVAELLIRPNGMTVPSPYDQIRLDFVSNLNNQFESARYEHDHPFKSFQRKDINLSPKLRVFLSPFVWNRVEIRSKAIPNDFTALTDWANKWMDITDTKKVAKGSLVGVVHSIGYPQVIGTYWTTVVDFGSADASVVEDLLRTLQRMGLTEVEVGTFSPIQ